jgi:protein involved in polysaccharide export with SLBB domain
MITIRYFNIFKIIIIFFLVFTVKELRCQQLNPGDGIRLTLYNISDKVSGDYYVQADGKILLPYLGEVRTQNMDFKTIKNEITSEFRSYYQNVDISVQPLYKISVLGEVKKPALYYVTGVEKFSDVIALAGGETQDADLNSVYLIRNNAKIAVDARKIFKDGKSIDDVGLQSGDKIYVPRHWWVSVRNTSVLVSVGTLIVAVLSLRLH